MLYRMLEELGANVTMVTYPRTQHTPREPKLRIDCRAEERGVHGEVGMCGRAVPAAGEGASSAGNGQRGTARRQPRSPARQARRGEQASRSLPFQHQRDRHHQPDDDDAIRARTSGPAWRAMRAPR